MRYLTATTKRVSAIVDSLQNSQVLLIGAILHTARARLAHLPAHENHDVRRLY